MQGVAIKMDVGCTRRDRRGRKMCLKSGTNAGREFAICPANGIVLVVAKAIHHRRILGENHCGRR